MEKVMRFDGNLDMFRNIVLLYKNEEGNTYIGSSSSNNTSDKDHKNHIVLYKDSMPKDKDYIAGWNYLDDNCSKTYIVFNQFMEVAVDDFMAAHNINKTWKDIDYNIVDSLNDVSDSLMSSQLKKNEVRAYGVLK